MIPCEKENKTNMYPWRQLLIRTRMCLRNQRTSTSRKDITCGDAMKIPLPASAMRVASTTLPTTLPPLPSLGRCQDVASWISRGGGADALDLTRIGMRLSAMSSYALVSSLLLGSGLYLFAITPLKVSDNKREGRMGRIEKAATAIFSIMITINIVSSLHMGWLQRASKSCSQSCSPSTQMENDQKFPSNA